MLIPLFKYGKKCYTLKGLIYPIAPLEHPFHANKVFLAVAPISYYAIIQWQQLIPLPLRKEYISIPESRTSPLEQPTMTNYKRPLRVSKTKPYTIDNEETASLVQWLRIYPMMRKNPRAWFHRRHKWSQAELKATAAAGFADVALALGYEYHTPLKPNSTPMIISIAPQPQPDVVERAAA